MINEYGAVGEMRVGKGNLSTQIPYDLIWDRTKAGQS
jgi:hypothetical protein